MRRRVRNRGIILTVIFFLMCIGIAAFALIMGDMGDVFSSYFSKQELLDDYEYFWSKLEENWPYLHTAQENDIDLNEIKKKYKKKISRKPSDINFYNTMSDIAEEISSHSDLGKVYAVDYYWQLIMSMDKRYNANPETLAVFKEEDKNKRYIQRYVRKHLNIRTIDNYSIYIIAGAYNSSVAQDSFNTNIKVEIIEQDKIAKIKINSMFVSMYNSIMAETYEKNFRRIYKDLSNYEHIIFDLTNCVGTNSDLWEHFIVAPNIETDKEYDITCIYNDTEYNKIYYDKASRPVSELTIFKNSDVSNNFTSYFKHTVRVKSNLYEDNILKAKKWILIGEKTRLEAKNFVNYAKETKFATVVGDTIGKVDVPLGVAMIKLPNTSLVLAYDGLQYLDDEGDKLGDIIPDIKISEGEDALAVCLDEIRK